MDRLFVRFTLILLLMPAIWTIFMPVAATASSNDPVAAALFSDTEAVVAGKILRLGVRLRMDKDWHTYWRNSGDAGMPTQIKWELPEGFQAGPLLWPVPNKYSEDGLIVFGYGNETLLSSTIQVPEHLPADSMVVFRAVVQWLACKDVCIPGGDTLSLEMPTLLRAGVANEALFSLYDKQIPRELIQDEKVELGYNVISTQREMQIDIGLQAINAQTVELIDFYPQVADEFIFHPPQENNTNKRRLQFKLELYGDEGKPEILPGLLVYQVEGKEKRFATVRLDLRTQGWQGTFVADSLDAKVVVPVRTFGFFVLMGMLGGLILNLMPCVLPVIALKVLSFVSQAGAERAVVRRLGLLFSSGIIVAFLGLAMTVVILKAGGEKIGWGFQFQTPGFVMAITALIFVLGLSLLGVFTVQLPGMQNNLGTLADGKGGLSAFFNGILATILATPCTAPFLGTALGFAFGQDAGAIITIFAAIGFGMALPYILLALQPGWLRFLPAPGAWMERFKQLMGFMLMATVLWLLWVLGKQLGMEAVIWTSAFLLVLSLGAWIIGTWIDLRSSTRRRVGAWIVALGLSLGAYLVFVHPVLTAVDKWDKEGGVEALEWHAFSSAVLNEFINQEQLIFIDFTAAWCWTCKVNERTVLAQKRVRDKFSDLGVVLVKADWTQGDNEITTLLHDFGRSGVPLYVIYPRGRPDQPLILPEIITVDLLLAKLDEAHSMASLER